MTGMIPKLALTVAIYVCVPCPAFTAQDSQSTTPANTQLSIEGTVSSPLKLSLADLKKLPRKTVSVVSSHSNKPEKYEGVLLEELLRRAGVAQREKLRGPVMETYVVAEALDGYRVVFSLAELDSDFTDSDVIVADTMDGAPLQDKQGPFKIVVPHDKRPARWVRMVRTITVVAAK